MDKSPLQFFQDKYDPIAEQAGEQPKSEKEWRQQLGKYGVSGELQKRKMGTFSDGQKARVVFSMMSLANPHMLMLDEPTNHLDMTCIDALAEAILAFNGGTVLVSHDFRLIDRVAKEIWVCDQGVTPWKGDIKTYKKHLSKAMKKAAKARMTSCVGAAAGGKTAAQAAAETEAQEVPDDVSDEAEEAPQEEKLATPPAKAEEAPKEEAMDTPAKEEPKLPEPELVPYIKNDEVLEALPMKGKDEKLEALPMKMKEEKLEALPAKGKADDEELPPWLQKRGRASRKK